jgi:hypothetical protein
MPHQQPVRQSGFDGEVSEERVTRDVSIIRRRVEWNVLSFKRSLRPLSRKEVCDGRHNYLKTVRQRR